MACRRKKRKISEKDWNLKGWLFKKLLWWSEQAVMMPSRHEYRERLMWRLRKRSLVHSGWGQREALGEGQTRCLEINLGVVFALVRKCILFMVYYHHQQQLNRCSCIFMALDAEPPLHPSWILNSGQQLGRVKRKITFFNALLRMEQ